MMMESDRIRMAVELHGFILEQFAEENIYISTMKRVSFYTLGCKLNQAETAILAEQFEQAGYQIVPFGEPVDLCVINTCTVTGKTDYQCRQMIRRAKHQSPNAQIAVVGCYAQLAPEKLRAMDGVDFILGSDAKFGLIDLLNQRQERSGPLVTASQNKRFIRPSPGKFFDHTRAFLKIQDGCDSRCSYCTVPLARGPSRSDELNHVIESAKKLVENGHRELVLTGVHIGRYGRDLNPPMTLLQLIKQLEPIEGLERIRLSSLEPGEIDDSLIQWIGQSSKICRHFHIPLQSADDEILDRMHRDYSSWQYQQIIERITREFPNCGLGTDVIVGFPGETEVQFQNTYQLIERLPFTYLHVFSYSARPGTEAAQLKPQVDPRVIKQRSELLRLLGKRKKQKFLESLVGQRLRVLWEAKNGGPLMFGWSDNYARVAMPTNAELYNTLTNVEIIAMESNWVIGRMIP